MPQIVLSPEDPALPGSWRPPKQIPPFIRAFGKFPNTHTWRAGDLILTSAAQPSRLQESITKAQLRGGYAVEDSRWQHAAVYMGENYILEATRTGVHYSPVHHLIPGNLLRVRRDITVTDADSYRIAIQAAFRFGNRYSFSTIWSIFRWSFRGFGTIRPSIAKMPHSSLICSQLYADAYEAVTMRLLANQRPATPADLSQNDQLQDLPVAWLAIP
jgi:hypothetical protein